jgi:Glycosyl hydrolases family 18
MRRHPRIMLTAMAAATATAAAIGFTAAGASAGTGRASGLPRHVFAPYFESYDTSGGLAALSRQSGARFLALAFLQTAQAGSCTAYWNGDTGEPIAAASFGAGIATIQRAGGNVIPSFGGYSADTTGTDIADSCPSASSIAQVYEKVITTYHVPRIDLDIEANSLTNTAGINRRNEAVAQTEAWAAAHHRRIQFSYTMPSTTTGMTASEQAVIQNAIADGARINVVNLMTFDYYIGTKQNMATDTKTAATGGHGQLQALYPGKTSQQVWQMIGITEMPGIDDFGAGETFTQADARTVLNWARDRGIRTLSFWALQRDNGGCPGTKGAGTCSGIKQPAWYFSHTFEPFTR